MKIESRSNSAFTELNFRVVLSSTPAPSESMKKPTIYIVGFQKCASSTLFDVLISHPDIVGTCPKETFFLTDKEFDHYSYNKNIVNERSSWKSFIKEDNNFVVEASVCNFYQKKALEYISKQDDCRIVFIVRDPVERFISVYKYLYGKINGIPASMTLDDFYLKCMDDYFESHILKYAVEHGQYDKYIKMWKNKAGEKRVHVLGMKYLIQKPDDTLDKLYDFLSLEKPFSQTIPHINPSKTYIYPLLHKQFVNLFRGTFFSNRFTRSFYNKLLMKPLDKDNLRFEFKGNLRCMYEVEYRYYSHLF